MPLYSGPRFHCRADGLLPCRWQAPPALGSPRSAATSPCCAVC